MKNSLPPIKHPNITELLQLHKSKKYRLYTQPIGLSDNTTTTEENIKILSLKDGCSKKSILGKNLDLVIKRSEKAEKLNTEPKDESHNLSLFNLHKTIEKYSNCTREFTNKKNLLDNIVDRIEQTHHKSSTYETTYVKKDTDSDFCRLRPVDPHYKPISYSALNRIASEKNVRKKDSDNNSDNLIPIMKAITHSELKTKRKPTSKDATSVDFSISDECTDVNQPVYMSSKRNNDGLNKHRTVSKKTNLSIKSVKFSDYNQIITYNQNSIIFKKRIDKCVQTLFCCY